MKSLRARVKACFGCKGSLVLTLWFCSALGQATPDPAVVVVTVPEPSIWGLFAIGAVGLVAADIHRKRKKKQKKPRTGGVFLVLSQLQFLGISGCSILHYRCQLSLDRNQFPKCGPYYGAAQQPVVDLARGQNPPIVILNLSSLRIFDERFYPG